MGSGDEWDEDERGTPEYSWPRPSTGGGTHVTAGSQGPDQRQIRFTDSPTGWALVEITGERAATHDDPGAPHVLRARVRAGMGRPRALDPLHRPDRGDLRPVRLHEPRVHPGRLLAGHRRRLPGLAALRSRGLGSYFRRLTLWRMPGAWWAFLVVGIPAKYLGAAINGSSATPSRSRPGTPCCRRWRSRCSSGRSRSSAGAAWRCRSCSAGSRRSGRA